MAERELTPHWAPCEAAAQVAISHEYRLKNTNFRHLLPLNSFIIIIETARFSGDFPFMPGADYIFVQILVGSLFCQCPYQVALQISFQTLYEFIVFHEKNAGRDDSPCLHMSQGTLSSNDNATEYIVGIVLTLDVLFFLFLCSRVAHCTLCCGVMVKCSVMVPVSFGGQEVTDALLKSLILKNDLVNIKAPLSL